MKKAKSLIFYLVILLIAGLFHQCKDEHLDRYDDPPWFDGTNIETLEKAGNYDIFIALMDKADYRTSIENQMFTLFVPSDSSFNAYFQKVGKSSIEDFTVQEAEELFGLHILVNPRNREQLMYEYAWGELQDENGEYATLYNRKRTYSVPADYSEEVKYYSALQGQTVKIYRQNTWISLWTTEFFEDYFGRSDGSDYLFMYPDSKWSGTQWNDAMVTEAEVRTSTGFIYYVDRVVAQIPTIDLYLKQNPDKFSLYYDLAQRYATYRSPILNENNERTYRKAYSNIIDFADERGPGGPSTYIEPKMHQHFSSFIPYDNVLQDFLDNTVLQTYESIDSVPELFITYLLQSHLLSFLSLPSKMDDRFYNYYGDNIALNINTDIGEAHFCSNGIMYGMNKVLEPNAFTCVPGPVFYDKNYTTSLFALNQSGLLTTLTNEDVDVTLFAADNDALFDYGIQANTNGNTTFIQVQSSDGSWHDMSSEEHVFEEFVKDHYSLGKIDINNGEGFIKMASNNYVYYNNGDIIGGGNQFEGETSSVKEKIESEKNGNLFFLTKPIKQPLKAAQILFNDPELSMFYDLLIQAELINYVHIEFELPDVERPKITFIGGDDIRLWTILAPTNQAIIDAQNAGIIPTETAQLRKFLYYHFANGECVFDDGVYSGVLKTQLEGPIVDNAVTYETLEFINSYNNLSVTDKSGQTVNISHASANTLIQRGVIHKINSVLTID